MEGNGAFPQGFFVFVIGLFEKGKALETRLHLTALLEMTSRLSEMKNRNHT